MSFLPQAEDNKRGLTGEAKLAFVLCVCVCVCVCVRVRKVQSKTTRIVLAQLQSPLIWFLKVMFVLVKKYSRRKLNSVTNSTTESATLVVRIATALKEAVCWSDVEPGFICAD